MGRLVTVPMASANSLLRWLAVMVVDGSDQSEVEALNDDVGKWEWVPDGHDKDSRSEQSKIEEKTFKTLAETAAAKSRSADAVLQVAQETLEADKTALKAALQKEADAAQDVATNEAAKALEKVAEKSAAPEDAKEVVQSKEADNEALVEAKQNQEDAKKQVEKEEEAVKRAKKSVAKADADKVAKEAKADALQREEIESMNLEGAEKIISSAKANEDKLKDKIAREK